MSDTPSNRHESEDFNKALNRLEKAVQDLVSTTAGQLSNRATSLIDETSKRIESELRLREATDDPGFDDRRETRRHGRRHRHKYPKGYGRQDRLTRDPKRGKIAGVCAGLAPYLGVEIWVVRLAALSGLIFIPTVVFPAYWITYFVMANPKKRREDKVRRGRAKSDQPPVSEKQSEPRPKRPERPSRTLKNMLNDFTEAELRLRRMESYVTSDRYELTKELTKIESESSSGSR